MNKIYILLFIIYSTLNLSIAEDNVEYKQIPINFDKIENDTLDKHIISKGKKSVLKDLDSIVLKLSNLIKFSTQNIKTEEIAFQLKGVNSYYKLGMDSSLFFDNNINLDSTIGRVYNIISGDTNDVKNQVEKVKQNKDDFYELICENIYKDGFRKALYTYCNYIDFIDARYLDTLYKAALIYPNIIRNEYYYALAEFDRNCGNAQNNAAFYKTQLYNKMKEDMSLEKALTDTNTLSALNASKYILTPKYQFFAYSLYAKNFDIKNNQKEVIYFLSSQNKQDGGFREYNLDKAEKTINSKIEPTFYAFWALLELREQINALYPDDVVIKKPTSVDTTIKTPTKPAPKKK
jgi:hypothetical protein